MSGRKTPPLCRVCGEPLWRSKHPFRLCPMAEPIPGGPEMMRLRVDGFHDGLVRVMSRTRTEVVVVTALGDELRVQARGVLFPVDQVTAA